MRYLFFDIECCDGKHICEFGYVITDENFNVLEKDDITINPRRKFDIGKKRPLTLAYTEDEYRKSPLFPFYYDRIKSIIEHPNQIIVGHAISNDAQYLNVACDDYDLESIDFKFIDTQKMFSEYINNYKSFSLENVAKELGVDLPVISHKADEDSLATMNVLRGLCLKLDVTLEDLINMCETCTGSNYNFAYKYDHYRNKRSAISRYDLVKNSNKNAIIGVFKKMFNKFALNTKPQGDIIQSEITGKTLCISMNYESVHFREMLALVQLIVNNGAEYKLKASLNDIFVSYDKFDESGKEIYCSRKKYVEQAISEGKEIKIISFEELLSILKVKEEDLSKFDFPDKDCFGVAKQKQTRKPKTIVKRTKSKSIGTSLADIFKDAGIEIDADE